MCMHHTCTHTHTQKVLGIGLLQYCSGDSKMQAGLQTTTLGLSFPKCNIYYMAIWRAC